MTARAATALPIDEIVPSLRAALVARTVAVLEAPPGAGKTTRVPLALVDEPWLAGLKLVMLEPRRLAARAAASYMASILGEEVGQTVGYRVRGETRISKRTRIEVVTEGVLARMLSADAALEGIGIHLQGDHLVAMPSDNLGDTGTHGAESDDADRGDGHGDPSDCLILRVSTCGLVAHTTLPLRALRTHAVRRPLGLEVGGASGARKRHQPQGGRGSGARTVRTDEGRGRRCP